jgi:hypothetical protein
VLARPIIETSTKNLVVITSTVRSLMHIDNEDCSTARIQSRHAPAPTGFTKVVRLICDDGESFSILAVNAVAYSRREKIGQSRTVGLRLFARIVRKTLVRRLSLREPNVLLVRSHLLRA